MLVFSEHDLISDPPFSRLDLITCRNLLIYIGASLQKRLIPLLHYALRPGGYLFLGNSESIGELGDRFVVIDRAAKLYQRRGDSEGAWRTPLGRFVEPAVTSVSAVPPAGREPQRPTLRGLTETALLRTGPSAALVDARGDVLYLHGRTGPFLEPAAGETRRSNLLEMAREGLRPDLAVALHQVASTGAPTQTRGARVSSNGAVSTVDIAVHPVRGAVEGDPEPLFLVVFEARAADSEAAAATTAPAEGAPGDGRVAALERELVAKDAYLERTRDALEASNRDLRAANEELQSVNEELQSTNEELETSKEELQSVNEELATVNAELQTKVADLSRANNDLNNLLAGTGIGTVFLDRQLRILRFTPAVTRIINLIRSDVGRPVAHLVSNLVGYDALVADTEQVLDTLVPKELEVQTKDGQWFTMRILPYRTLENVIEGAVITFVDIGEIVAAREALRRSEARDASRRP